MKSPYHLQANGIVEAFNKIMKNGLTKVCCTNREYWDEIFPTVLWAYQITTNKLQKYNPFWLVFGWEDMVLGEFILPILFVVQATKRTDDESIATRVKKLMELDEAKFLEDFYQTIEKS